MASEIDEEALSELEEEVQAISEKAVVSVQTKTAIVRVGRWLGIWGSSCWVGGWKSEDMRRTASSYPAKYTKAPALGAYFVSAKCLGRNR